MQFLLSGGQACVLYGGTSFTADTDILVVASAANLDALRAALHELHGELAYVPPLEADFLNRGHACHFHCRHPEAANHRLDIMSVLRGCDPFQLLWARRTTIELPELGEVNVLGLPDLVQSKKTQRDKDWVHIRRLVDVDYADRRSEAEEAEILWWLEELRSPRYLIELAARRPSLVPRVGTRPWLAGVSAQSLEAIESALYEEERLERAADRAYWAPLYAELERLRRARRAGGTGGDS